MKVDEALKNWCYAQLQPTMRMFNEIMASQGKSEHVLDENTVRVQFMISDPVKCPHGHDWTDDCMEALPPRPVLRVMGVTREGQPIANDLHVADFTILDLMKAVIAETPDGEITLK